MFGQIQVIYTERRRRPVLSWLCTLLGHWTPSPTITILFVLGMLFVFLQPKQHQAVVFFASLLSSLLLLGSGDAVAAKLVKPGCEDRCGNVSIPYPFGMGSGCFMDEPFEIICNSSAFNPPRPFLAAHTSKEVIEVSLEQHYVRIFRTFVTQNCYDSHSGQGSIYSSHSSNYTPFTFSATLNKFIAIGCDILAYISADDSGNYTAGCVSLCPTTIPDVNSSSSSCSGLGCCRTSIPKGIYFYNLYIHSINTNERTWSSENCSVAFLAARDFSDFNKFLSINNKELHNQKYPVVLDWGVGNGTCEESRKSKNSSTYACGDANTYCIDSDSGSGYNCYCSQGFHGNPYLPSGCQDIDECKDPNIKRNCHSAATCINTEGSYYCACPSGYHGDGIKLGKGCLPVPDKRSLPLAVVVPLGIGIAMVLITLFGFGLWGYATVKRRKQIKLKQTYFKKNGGLLLERQISSCEGSGRVESTKIFVEEELERATDNFNENRILGKGGFGTVYKGMLSDGKIVAIKKSQEVDENQVNQFINELMILSQINHRNIVKLLGCCLETEVPLLVYEFISNGTLSNLLHDEDYLPSLSWEMRLRIAVQIAGALAYLHSAASIPIFHRDIKPSNILMDEKYNPKVSDFGISRSVPIDKTHLTTAVQGTFGYLDPEHLHSGIFTEKSDVYSFGVVLVELLTGKKAIDSSRPNEAKSLTMQFTSLMKENRLFDILETQVVKEAKEDELLIVARVAKRCLKLNGKKRPTMKEVAADLERIVRSHEPSLEEDMWLEKGISCHYTNNLTEIDTTYGSTISTTNGKHEGDSSPLLYLV